MLRFALVAALLIGLAACDEPKSERTALSKTATVLPPGVRQQWFAALDQAMKEELSIYKGRVRIQQLFGGGVTYTPITSLQAECSPLVGISLIAPRGGEDVESSINLVGAWGAAIGQGVSPPVLGVGRSSPAAISLMDDLCRHLVDRLEAMATGDQAQPIRAQGRP